MPRVLEVIQGRIMSQVARQPAWKQRLFRRALEFGYKRQDGIPLSLFLNDCWTSFWIASCGRKCAIGSAGG